MQVNALDHHDVMLQPLFRNEEESTRKRGYNQIGHYPLLSSNLKGQEALKISSNIRRYEIYKESFHLQEQQRDYRSIQKVDSYLEELQKILWKLKEFTNQIVRQSTSQDNIENSLDNLLIQNREEAISHINKLIDEYPLLKDIIINLDDVVKGKILDEKSFLQKISQLESDTTQKRLKLWQFFEETEKKMNTQKPDKIQDNLIPNSLYKNFESDLVVELLR